MASKTIDRRIGGTWAIQSAFAYAKICNAVYSGIHATLVAGERVACGGTAPISYQWYADNGLCSAADIISGATSSTYSAPSSATTYS